MKIDLLKYLLWKWKDYKETWIYIFKHFSLYSFAYEIRREAKYNLFYPLLDLIFMPRIKLIDMHLYFLEHAIIAGAVKDE